MSPTKDPLPSNLRMPCWEILELDHPDHLECYHCKKLHSIIDVLAHPEVWPKCRKGDQKLRVANFFHPDFDLLIFRTIMKQHRQGKDQRNLMKLLAYHGKAIIEDAQVKRFVAEPRVVNGRLLMRSHTVYVVPPAEGPNRVYLFDRNLLKCPHTCRWSRCNTIVTKRLHERCGMLKSMVANHQEHIMDFRCDFCPTEFDVSLERFEGQGTVLCIIKWQDIDMGLSPLDEDLSPIISRRLDLCVTPRGEKLDYESPRARFEGFISGAASAVLSSKEREGLFALYNSRRAKLLRCRDKVRWPLLGYGRPFPHHYAPSPERELGGKPSSTG